MFDAPFFADPQSLLLGALTGLIFGVLLVRGGVADANVIWGQFLLKDFTVLKVMGTAIVIGGIGIYGMRTLGVLGPEDMHIKGAALMANAVGGLIFGAGMALLGYCPGTAVAAIGAGSRDAIVGVFGMIVGAGVYAEAYPWLQSHVLKIGSYGEVTLPQVLHVSPWLMLVSLAAVAAVGFILIERWEQRRRDRTDAEQLA